MGSANKYIKFLGIISTTKKKNILFSFIYIPKFRFIYLQTFIIYPISARNCPRAWECAGRVHGQ